DEVVLELEESIQEDEDVLELEESIQEEEIILELEESIQEEEQFESIQTQTEDLPADVNSLTSKKQEESENIENQPHDISNQEQNKPRRKTVPFNVMMLGRDKQKLREKGDHSYQFPSLAYLNIPEKELTEDHTWLESQKDLLNVTLLNFNVRASVVNVTQGPSVTRFEVHPEPGVKVNKITNLSDDIKLSLSAKDIRIEAPIPGKNTIGIEVPNKVSKMVYLREILRSNEFRSNPSPMTAVLGLDIAGQPTVTDLKKMPHGLIAGATGSGKSVCINTILVSLLYKASPHEVKLMLIDPKMVELAPYNDIPHLVSPVITDVKAATAALKWAVEEMERRYELFAHSGTREITRYNQLVKEHKQGEHLPYLVIVIDELADLMMVAPNDVEEAICRIAQKARACGIHLIVATQRPSVDVITGLIKANIPTRIAFSVSSQVDSRTIIDVNGAEKLLGKGDMLFLENGSSKAVRLQGTFVSDEEIERVVKHVKLQSKPDYLFHQDELVKKATIQSEEDELFLEACEFVVNQGGASTSSLQRRFRIGYNRAARLIDMMEEQGIISENRGSKPRDVLISEEELDAIQDTHVL
ncbi:MAG TPA: DNA translocase FtsK, partial [Metabacillus sp.]|nr:DNA translocase FtsK [Metabacillus sp.]